MRLIDQHTKSLMEDCKSRARDAGLSFNDESLEYIVTNKDLNELNSKVMIPTIYDYWVDDVKVLQKKSEYELYPSNPYETVINTRPAISFYNDNNPDWLNIMIFYHVLGHIDFFQNNVFFQKTGYDDFLGKALADKRLIERLRSEHGRWVDYAIEFSRGIDNLVGFFDELRSEEKDVARGDISPRIDFYFDNFLQNIKGADITEYLREVERYNNTMEEFSRTNGEDIFFSEVNKKHPEFRALFETHRAKNSGKKKLDLLEYIAENSEFLSKDENSWMKDVMAVVRDTRLFFSPQGRTRIMNEGWASYWHDKLFLQDERIRGHETSYAKINAGVLAMPKVGVNPYAIGKALYEFVEESLDKGMRGYDFERILDQDKRQRFDKKLGRGIEGIFDVRQNLSDHDFIQSFVNQDFVDRNKLFVAGMRVNPLDRTVEYYVKSRKAEDYKDMLKGQLYHPPHITFKEDAEEGELYLDHHFEGYPLVKDHIHNTMLGIEYLWGKPVYLDTTEVDEEATGKKIGELDIDMFTLQVEGLPEGFEPVYQRVRYSMEDRELSKEVIEEGDRG